MQVWVDPYTLQVAGLTSERWHGIASESEKNSLPLRTLRQISDVILVDSAAAALYQAPPAAMRLVGLPVKTAAGDDSWQGDWLRAAASHKTAIGSLLMRSNWGQAVHRGAAPATLSFSTAGHI